MLGEDEAGPQLFSPRHVRAAMVYQKEKKDAIVQEKTEKAKQKAEAVAAQQQRDQEKKEQMLQQKISRQRLAK